MSKRNKIRMAVGSMLVLVIAATCTAVYQSGSNSTPNKKELVKNEESIADEAIRTEEKQEEESEDVNTSEVEGTRVIEDTEDVPSENTVETEDETAQAETEETQPEAEVQDTSASVEQQAEMAAAPDINFTESSLMEWPVSGQIAIDYNMDHTVYFPTLNVYKYSPAVAISSEIDTPVAAVANGQVISVVNDEETGMTMTVDMGNGYQAVYGQLKDVAYQQDDYVEAGSILGYVGEPTKYYVKEGANLYFALTKDGTPLDPLQYLP